MARLRLDDGRRRLLVVDGQVSVDDGAPVDQALEGAGCLTPPLLDLQGDVAGAQASSAGFGGVLPRRGASVPRPGVLVGALTVNTEGRVIADHGRLREAGARVLSDGDLAHHDLDVMLGAARWAAATALPILARPGVTELERGVVAASDDATRRGLPAVLAEGEALGVHRWGAVARATGATVHLLPLWSAAGVAALVHERGTGAALTAGTTPLHLAVEMPWEEGRGAWRSWPVVGAARDREALRQAVIDGHITTLSTGSRLVADHEVQAPLVDQAPRGLLPAEAVGLAVELFGAAKVAELMGSAPRRLLGLAGDAGASDPTVFATGVVWLEAGNDLVTHVPLGRSVRSGVRGVWGGVAGLACPSRRR